MALRGTQRPMQKAYGHPAVGQRRPSISQYSKAWLHAFLLGASLLLALSQLGVHVSFGKPASATAQTAGSAGAASTESLVEPVLVSYSYFEKDEVRWRQAGPRILPPRPPVRASTRRHSQPRRDSLSAWIPSQVQKANMEFFMAVGMGLYSHLPAPRRTDFVVVISGELCGPCRTLMPLMEPVKDISSQPQLSAAWSGQASSPRLPREC